MTFWQGSSHVDPGLYFCILACQIEIKHLKTMYIPCTDQPCRATRKLTCNNQGLI